jgi:hypothetical protein
MTMSGIRRMRPYHRRATEDRGSCDHLLEELCVHLGLFRLTPRLPSVGPAAGRTRRFECAAGGEPATRRQVRRARSAPVPSMDRLVDARPAGRDRQRRLPGNLHRHPSCQRPQFDRSGMGCVGLVQPLLCPSQSREGVGEGGDRPE